MNRDICGKTFANASNLLRHKKVVHAYGTRNLGQQTLTVNGVTVMQHPFTCIVAGCTQSGKTVWVKSLLENAQTTISPTPQRIIWCYGQWQPSYFDMMRIMPGIEFIEGIPDDIDNADYLDVSQRNLILLDDLMTQSGKDKRIYDLFKKGSHHRNLSIIYVVQNIFHQDKEMRNISLNAHYIVLFKSPRDKQQISMLARQINPGKVQEFMKSYEDATSRPHGYLMLDLKPTTDDQQRLKTNVLPGEIAMFLHKQSHIPGAFAPLGERYSYVICPPAAVFLGISPPFERGRISWGGDKSPVTAAWANSSTFLKIRSCPPLKI